MICPKCGKESNSTDALFCQFCGSSMTIQEKDEKPYYSVEACGITTTYTRSGFRSYFGWSLATLWAFFVMVLFIPYIVNGNRTSLAAGVVAIIFSPILYLIVEYLWRADRPQKGSK